MKPDVENEESPMKKYYDHCFWMTVDEEVIKKFEDIETAKDESTRLAAIAAHLDRIDDTLCDSLGILLLKYPAGTPAEDPNVQEAKKIIDGVLTELWHFKLRIEDNCPQIEVHNCTPE